MRRQHGWLSFQRAAALILAAVVVPLLINGAFAAAAPEEHPDSRMSGVALIPRGQMRLLQLSIEAQLRCSFGDLEAIMLEVMASRNKSLLLTLEPVLPDDDSFAPVVHPLGEQMRDIVRGRSALSLDIPAVPSPKLLGFYICKDSAAEGRCGNKPVQDITEVLQTYQKGRVRPPDFDPADKIYFFKFALLDGGRLYFPDKAMSAPEYEKTERFLQDRLGGGYPVAAAMTRMKELGKTLGSEPLAARNDQEAIIRLPRLSRQKCSKRERGGS